MRNLTNSPILSCLWPCVFEQILGVVYNAFIKDPDGFLAAGVAIYPARQTRTGYERSAENILIRRIARDSAMMSQQEEGNSSPSPDFPFSAKLGV